MTAEVRPATDLLIAQIRDAIAESAAHEHHVNDIFCLNLHSWMGERMRFVLARLEQEQASAKEWKDRYDVLATQVEAGEYERGGDQ